LNFPIVYDKFDTSYVGYGLAILDNAKDVKVREKLNGEHTLEFTLPRDDEKWSEVQIDNFVKVDEKLYIIRTLDEVRDNNGRLLSNVQCESIISELLDEYISYFELINVSAQYAVDTFISGTRFKADATRITVNNDIEVEDCTPVAAINKMITTWKCEVECAGLPDVDGKIEITLLPQRGSDNGVQFRYRKNLKSIKKTSDGRGIITRLYPIGKDGLGIESVNSGVAYLDSASIGAYPRPKKASKKFNDIDDPTELKQAGIDYLATVDTPKVTYDVDILELKALADFGSTESFDLGDVIRVIDEELGIDVACRIVDYERYPYEPTRSKVILANYLDTIIDYLGELEEAKRVVDSVTYKNKINTYWLDGVINVLQNKFNSSQSNWYTDDNGNIIFEAQDGSSAMKLAGDGFALSNEKDVSGAWIWRTFGTGSGITADEINAGILNASVVRILADIATSIDGSGIHIANGNSDRVRIGEYSSGKYGVLVTDGTANQVELGEYESGKVGLKAANGSSRVIIDGTNGFKIQKTTNGGSTWSDQLYIDSSGTIHLVGGVIDWNSVSAPSATQVGALSSDSPKLTYIGSDGIYTGTLSADRINGGTINADVINVTNINAGNLKNGTTLNGQLVNITNLNASNITSGTISADRISTNISQVNTQLRLGSPGQTGQSIIINDNCSISNVGDGLKIGTMGAITFAAGSGDGNVQILVGPSTYYTVATREWVTANAGTAKFG
jgi:phage minor structural protein